MNERVRREYLEIVQRLIKATEEKRAVWKRQNPTTFYLEKPEAVLSLQKIQSQNTYKISAWRYIFMIKKRIGGDIALQISTANENEFQDVLQLLYSKVEYNVESENIDFLRGLIGDI